MDRDTLIDEILRESMPVKRPNGKQRPDSCPLHRLIPSLRVQNASE